MVSSADIMRVAASQTGQPLTIPSVPPPGFAGIKARVVVAFDVDGTLENSLGPVSIERLTQLQSGYPYVAVAIVSPSAKRPPGFPSFLVNGGGDRLANLLAVKQAFPSDLYVYVSDNGDMEVAKKAGFSYVDAKAFV